MKKKVLLLLTLSSSLACISTVLAFSDHSIAIDTKASECSYHHGCHYEYLAPDIGKAGHEEFWTCCNCCHQFLEKPNGNFIDAYDDQMTGGLDENHIAYIAPLEGVIYGNPYLNEDDCLIIGFEW